MDHQHDLERKAAALAEEVERLRAQVAALTAASSLHRTKSRCVHQMCRF